LSNPDVVEEIRAHLESKGLSKKALAVVPVSPWHVHVAILPRDNALFQKNYAVLNPGDCTFTVGEVWDFWKSKCQPLCGNLWRAESDKSIRSL
jgi:hypothetical protein